MKRTYFCPSCSATLNPNVKIILRAQFAGEKGLFLFSPQPGDFDVIVPEGFRIRKKERVRFTCPVCGHDLTSQRDEGLAEIRFTSDEGVSGSVAFARAYGEHATYFITAEHVESFGENAEERGMNYWGVGPDV